MANNDHIVGFRAPALPYPPTEYSTFEFEEFNKVLRLYFNQVDNALRDRSLAQQSEAMGWFIS
tara:strand:+ start:436 stop:624 length:189 start_codon:yes stop_codon:yes gene_type:complete